MVKKSYIVFIVCLLSLHGFSQTLEDLQKTYTKRTVQQQVKQPKNTVTSQRNNNFDYRFCDDDNDGFQLIDLIPILDAVQAAVISDLTTEEPRLIVGTATGSILEIDDLLNNPTVTELCDFPQTSTDVAVNSSEQIFNNNGNAITQIDRNTCAETQIIAAGGTALSFDTQNNLYFNDTSQPLSQVFRLDAGFGSPAYVWHDFLEGLPGGDFVINGNFMYISWVKTDGSYVLFKVTIDADFNYISHEEVGQIREETFGLASEQGILYGVTGSEIYRINLSPFSMETVFLNDSSFGAWFGAAGVSEAIAFESTAHISEDDANDDENALPTMWTNTVAGGQTIYVRTEEVSSGNFIVTPVTIAIDPTPIVTNTPPNLQDCDDNNDGFDSFNLNLQTPDIIGTQDAGLFEVFYSTTMDFSSVITNPANYLAPQGTQTIYFRIVNRNNSTCFNSGSFTITVTPLNSCAQNLPPEISVSGRFPYCPQTDIRIGENFNITDPDDTGIETFSVQISAGYQINVDRLLLSGSHPTINASWDVNQGILTLSAVSGGEILYTDLIPAVRDIVYQSLNATVSGEKFFSFNIGDANYLPSTDHYYEYVEANLIDWESARIAAENRTYFGLQGYLVTILTPDEAQLAGEQAAGTGWIGGSDAAQEGVWRWVTGPEAGTIFWNGGINGSTPNFAFWNNNEPNNQGNEDYAHVTDPSVGILGSWNDLPLVGGSGAFVPRGYIVEYGGMPGDPILNISGSTSIFIPEITGTTGGSTCPNESVTLSATSTEGEIFWYSEATGGTLLGTGTTFVTPPLTATTIYYAAPAPQDCALATRVAVQALVNPLPVVTDPVLIEECSLDENGFFSFDLTQANALISTNFANETFQYYPTETDAQNDTNVIGTPAAYTNVNDTNDSVWVRTISIDGCFVISRVDLEVSNTVIPNTFLLEYEQCDDFLDSNGNNNSNNDDADGIATFNFSNATNQITGLFPAMQVGNISVTYYESEIDANNATNAIADIANHRNNNSPNTQQIYIRVENSANNNCLYVGTHITLNVLPVPISNPVPDLNICDDAADGDDTNGFVQNINLESQTLGVLGTQDPTLYTVTYHESSADAMSGSNPIASPYTNTALNQTIYIRVVEDATGCVTARNSFEINVEPLPTVNPVAELRQCDDDTDGFSVFNLNEAASDISANFADETFEFFETQADAENRVNPIGDPTAYTNQVQSSDTVWVRVIGDFDCFRVAQVNLIVATSSSVVTNFPPSTFSACDDFLDINGNDTANNDDTDGISFFNFDITEALRNAFPANERPNLIINYYRTQADALSELNAIADPTNYRNIGFPGGQQIYVRVDNITNNDCVGFAPLITLNIDPVPVSNPVADLEACDNSLDGDFSNGIIQNFNLDSQTPLILGAQDPTVYSVSYHTSAADASSGANAITNTSSYTNTTPNRQTIYVRVEHSTQGCFVDRGTFDLVVNPLPIANFVPDLQVCDTGAPGTAVDGVASGIDLEVQTADILGSQDPNQFVVTYHRSLEDAQTDTNPITGLYTNETPFIQTIHIRIVNTITGCVNDISNFNLVINTQPTVEDIGEFPVCDDDLDGDDTNGFVQNIDLDSRIPLLLGSGQDEDDFTVTFHEDPNDGISGANPLSSPYSNTNADSQTIYVRIVNDDTQCVNSDYSFNVIINPLPEFEVTSPQTLCVNDPDLTLQVENPAGIYDYVWTDPAGNETIGSQIAATTGGIYLVTATATDGTGCQRTREVEVVESIISSIADQDVVIVDDSDNNSITVDPTNLGIGDYEYALADENGSIIVDYQDDPTFENLEGAFYTILVRDKNGCGVASLEVSVLEFPKFFTPNQDGINDTWAIKGANSTFFPTAEINIFNRFGKVIAQINIDSPGWNGNFNGKIMPSDDYWFSVKLTDRNGVVRQRTGNLSLLRR